MPDYVDGHLVLKRDARDNCAIFGRGVYVRSGAAIAAKDAV